MKQIRGYPNYGISTAGEVKNLNTNKVLKQTIHSQGYYIVGLYNKEFKNRKHYVHVLVASHYLDGWNWKIGIECNHKDGNKLNNNITNLEIVNRSQNTKHAYDTGLFINPRRKLKEGEVWLVRRLLNSYYKPGGKQIKIIAKMFKTSDVLIYNILRHRTYRT